MNWKNLDNLDTLDKIISDSENETQVIFKHSTRCFISSMAKRKFESEWQGEVNTYLLDLIKFRSISNLIAEKFQVTHQSPQILVVKNGKSIYNNSHEGIDAQTVAGLA